MERPGPLGDPDPRTPTRDPQPAAGQAGKGPAREPAPVHGPGLSQPKGWSSARAMTRRHSLDVAGRPWAQERGTGARDTSAGALPLADASLPASGRGEARPLDEELEPDAGSLQDGPDERRSPWGPQAKGARKLMDADVAPSRAKARLSLSNLDRGRSMPAGKAAEKPRGTLPVDEASPPATIKERMRSFGAGEWERFLHRGNPGRQDKTRGSLSVADAPTPPPSAKPRTLSGRMRSLSVSEWGAFLKGARAQQQTPGEAPSAEPSAPGNGTPVAKKLSAKKPQQPAAKPSAPGRASGKLKGDVLNQGPQSNAYTASWQLIREAPFAPPFPKMATSAGRMRSSGANEGGAHVRHGGSGLLEETGGRSPLAESPRRPRAAKHRAKVLRRHSLEARDIGALLEAEEGGRTRAPSNRGRGALRTQLIALETGDSCATVKAEPRPSPQERKAGGQDDPGQKPRPDASAAAGAPAPAPVETAAAATPAAAAAQATEATAAAEAPTHEIHQETTLVEARAQASCPTRHDHSCGRQSPRAPGSQRHVEQRPSHDAGCAEQRSAPVQSFAKPADSPRRGEPLHGYLAPSQIVLQPTKTVEDKQGQAQLTAEPGLDAVECYGGRGNGLVLKDQGMKRVEVGEGHEGRRPGTPSAEAESQKAFADSAPRAQSWGGAEEDEALHEYLSPSSMTLRSSFGGASARKGRRVGRSGAKGGSPKGGNGPLLGGLSAQARLESGRDCEQVRVHLLKKRLSEGSSIMKGVEGEKAWDAMVNTNLPAAGCGMRQLSLQPSGCSEIGAACRGGLWDLEPEKLSPGSMVCAGRAPLLGEMEGVSAVKVEDLVHGPDAAAALELVEGLGAAAALELVEGLGAAAALELVEGLGAAGALERAASPGAPPDLAATRVGAAAAADVVSGHGLSPTSAAEAAAVPVPAASTAAAPVQGDTEPAKKVAHPSDAGAATQELACEAGSIADQTQAHCKAQKERRTSGAADGSSTGTGARSGVGHARQGLIATGAEPGRVPGGLARAEGGAHSFQDAELSYARGSAACATISRSRQGQSGPVLSADTDPLGLSTAPSSAKSDLFLLPEAATEEDVAALEAAHVRQATLLSPAHLMSAATLPLSRPASELFPGPGRVTATPGPGCLSPARRHKGQVPVLPALTEEDPLPYLATDPPSIAHEGSDLPTTCPLPGRRHQHSSSLKPGASAPCPLRDCPSSAGSAERDSAMESDGEVEWNRASPASATIGQGRSRLRGKGLEFGADAILEGAKGPTEEGRGPGASPTWGTDGLGRSSSRMVEARGSGEGAIVGGAKGPLEQGCKSGAYPPPVVAAGQSRIGGPDDGEWAPYLGGFQNARQVGPNRRRRSLQDWTETRELAKVKGSKGSLKDNEGRSMCWEKSSPGSATLGQGRTRRGLDFAMNSPALMNEGGSLTPSNFKGFERSTAASAATTHRLGRALEGSKSSECTALEFSSPERASGHGPCPPVDPLPAVLPADEAGAVEDSESRPRSSHAEAECAASTALASPTGRNTRGSRGEAWPKALQHLQHTSSIPVPSPCLQSTLGSPGSSRGRHVAPVSPGARGSAPLHEKATVNRLAIAASSPCLKSEYSDSPVSSPDFGSPGFGPPGSGSPGFSSLGFGSPGFGSPRLGLLRPPRNARLHQEGSQKGATGQSEVPAWASPRQLPSGFHLPASREDLGWGMARPVERPQRASSLEGDAGNSSESVMHERRSIRGPNVGPDTRSRWQASLRGRGGSIGERGWGQELSDTAGRQGRRGSFDERRNPVAPAMHRQSEQRRPHPDGLLKMVLKAGEGPNGRVTGRLADAASSPSVIGPSPEWLDPSACLRPSIFCGAGPKSPCPGDPCLAAGAAEAPLIGAGGPRTAPKGVAVERGGDSLSASAEVQDGGCNGPSTYRAPLPIAMHRQSAVAQSMDLGRAGYHIRNLEDVQGVLRPPPCEESEHSSSPNSASPPWGKHMSQQGLTCSDVGVTAMVRHSEGVLTAGCRTSIDSVFGTHGDSESVSSGGASGVFALDEGALRVLGDKGGEHFYEYVLGVEYRDVRQRYAMHDSLLGSRGFRTIRKCKDLATGKTYACKTIDKAGIRRPADADEIRQEVSCLLLVRGHPGIVAFRDAFEDQSHVHILTELCRGGDLCDRIVAKGHLAEADAAEICRSLAEVLLFCHSRGVVHRDVKPENVLLTSKYSDSGAKLVDFGSSTFFKPHRELTSMAGTLEYMAPEVLKGSYGPQADVWSLGVLLYVALSGVQPFWASCQESLMHQILNKSVSFKPVTWARVSDASKDLLARMLCKDPLDRMQLTDVLQHPWVLENCTAT